MNNWREAVLTATGLAAERILNSELEPAAFTDALRILGEGVGVDRAYVFRFHLGSEPGETLCSQLHEWCKPGVVPQIDNPELQDFCFADVGCRRWFEELKANRAICGDVRSFPVEEQPLLLSQEIRSIAVVPIFAHRVLWGFIGFDYCDREFVWNEQTVGALRLAARVFGTAFERSDYKQRNDALAAEYRRLLEGIREVVFRVSAEGIVTLLSPAWATFTGRDPLDCLGRPMRDFIHPDHRDRFARNACALMSGEKTMCHSELRFIHADGTDRWALGRAGLLRDASGAVAGFTGTFVDITSMKATEAALIEARAAAESANRAKSEFLSTMSHELRTPLNAVIGLSESLIEADGLSDPARARRYLDLIHRGGRQLLDLINDILSLTRIESGHTVPAPTPLFAGTLCREAADAFRASALSQSLVLAVEAPVDAPFHGDRALLLQALGHLVQNAVKFTPAGGTVTLSASVHGDRVRIAVRDTGIGIPADKLDRLFKPFSQVDASLSRRFGGTGLGLVIVERLVGLHRGRVSVESRPGAGSVFTIELPSTP